MLLKLTEPTSQWVCADSSAPLEPVTPFSLTLLMAYIHNYTPKRLPSCRLLGPNDIQRIAQFLPLSEDKIRSIRQDKVLASHLALLQAARFLDITNPYLALQPTVTNWLHAPAKAQLEKLFTLLENNDTWSQTLSLMKLQDTIPLDYTHYLRQSLHRQCMRLDNIKEGHPAKWQETNDQETWQLTLPLTLPLWLHFDLRQLGDWIDDTHLTCTPQTIKTAVQRGYGPEMIQWLFETATQAPLPDQQDHQLRRWCRQANAYQLRTVHLFSTARPEQMSDLLRQKPMRRAVIEQISPRHVLLHEHGIPYLKRQLANQNNPLECLSETLGNIDNHAPAATTWLATSILIKLGQITPLPCPPPHSVLSQLTGQLTPHQQTELEAMATAYVQTIQDAIQGRDAFFPARQSPTPWLIQQISQAIGQQTTLTIHYLPLNAQEPKRHTLDPHRLEKRGELYYLHAYSHRAEANLTFRLDRISQIEQSDS